MDEGLRRLNIPRHKYVVSTKIYFSHPDNLPNTLGLSRKHIIEGVRK